MSTSQLLNWRVEKALSVDQHGIEPIRGVIGIRRRGSSSGSGSGRTSADELGRRTIGPELGLSLVQSIC